MLAPVPDTPLTDRPLMSSGWFSTTTGTASEAEDLPVPSKTTTASRCGPSGVPAVFQSAANGRELTRGPRSPPSSWNCTAAASPEAALAVSATVPVRCAPAAGADSETVSGDGAGGAGAAGVEGVTPPPASPPAGGAAIGGWLPTTTGTASEVMVLPLRSYTVAVRRCGPSGVPAVFQIVVNGFEATRGPRSAPSSEN